MIKLWESGREKEEAKDNCRIKGTVTRPGDRGQNVHPSYFGEIIVNYAVSV